MCFLGRIGLDLDFIEIHAVEFGRHTIVEIGFQWFEKHSQPVHFNKGFEHMCVCVCDFFCVSDSRTMHLKQDSDKESCGAPEFLDSRQKQEG